MEEKIRNGECTAEEASGLSGQASAPENAPSAPGGAGFAPEEAAVLCERGAVPVSLGPRILRTETAGMATLAMALYELEL